MGRIIQWIKSNKIITLLVAIILILLIRPSLNRPYQYRNVDSFAPQMGTLSAPGMEMSKAFSGVSEEYIAQDYSARDTMQVENRMVVQNSYLSLLVNDVQDTKEQILAEATKLGGFMINSSINNPEENGTATITIRIPATKLDQALSVFKGYAVKVVSENLQGEDVTDSYTDIQARMETLVKTKAKFEDIFDKATEIQDILQVQREIINLQSQIDSLKGQAQYLENNAEMARLTIYLSTDELALPYSPNESWRPQLVFKEAVRSLILTFRKAANLVIWLAVFSVIWIPVLVVIWYIRRRKARQQHLSLDK